MENCRTQEEKALQAKAVKAAWVLVVTFLTATGCVTADPVSSLVSVAEAWIVTRHLDDTPEERLEWMTWRLESNRKWCRQGEASACERARVLAKELASR